MGGRQTYIKPKGLEGRDCRTVMNIHCYAKPRTAFPFIDYNEMLSAASIALKQQVGAWEHALAFAEGSSCHHVGISKNPGESLKKWESVSTFQKIGKWLSTKSSLPQLVACLPDVVVVGTLPFFASVSRVEVSKGKTFPGWGSAVWMRSLEQWLVFLRVHYQGRTPEFPLAPQYQNLPSDKICRGFASGWVPETSG